MVFLVGFPSAIFATNCFVLAQAPGQECVVVDPGIDVLDRLDSTLREHNLKPAAVLLTHGHIDHTYSVTPVCGNSDIPALIHTDDEYRLTDPIAQMNPELRGVLAQHGPVSWKRPPDVELLDDQQALTIAGLEFTVLHAPGHTEGSVMFAMPSVPDAVASAPGTNHPRSTVLSGDVLFAGSIGRTDLPGGSTAAMNNSLRTKVLPLADDTLILPGHGPATLMGHERVSNPYLQGL